MIYFLLLEAEGMKVMMSYAEKLTSAPVCYLKTPSGRGTKDQVAFLHPHCKHISQHSDVIWSVSIVSRLINYVSARKVLIEVNYLNFLILQRRLKAHQFSLHFIEWTQLSSISYGNCEQLPGPRSTLIIWYLRRTSQ